MEFLDSWGPVNLNPSAQCAKPRNGTTWHISLAKNMFWVVYHHHLVFTHKHAVFTTAALFSPLPLFFHHHHSFFNTTTFYHHHHPFHHIDMSTHISCHCCPFFHHLHFHCILATVDLSVVYEYPIRGYLYILINFFVNISANPHL